MDSKFVGILNRINPEILENAGVNLLEEGIIDSLSIMEIVSAIESEFEIDFDPDDISPENFENADCIWKTVQKYINA